MVGDPFGPGLLGDRLAIEEDAEGIFVLRRASLDPLHEALDAAAEFVLQLELRGSGERRLGLSRKREGERQPGEKPPDVLASAT